MIITCPSCTTRFEIDPTKLGPSGRKVRCIRCNEIWHQRAEEIVELEAAAEPGISGSAFPEAEPLPNFMRENTPQPRVEELKDDLEFAFTRRPPPPPKPKPERDKAKIAAWGAVAAALILFAGVAILGRASIVARWPALDSAYAMIGLKAESLGAGLELRGINSAIVPAQGKMSLVVAGEVANISSVPRAIPPLTIHLRDNTNKNLATWKIYPQRGKLPPGETLPFQTSMASPPSGASSAVVTFQP